MKSVLNDLNEALYGTENSTLKNEIEKVLDKYHKETYKGIEFNTGTYDKSGYNDFYITAYVPGKNAKEANKLFYEFILKSPVIKSLLTDLSKVPGVPKGLIKAIADTASYENDDEPGVRYSDEYVLYGLEYSLAKGLLKYIF